MFVIRLVALLLLITLGVLLAAGLFTRNPRYFDWARRLLRLCFVFAIGVMVAYLAERLLVAI